VDKSKATKMKYKDVGQKKVAIDKANATLLFHKGRSN
jgi:hypothetical protein